jgi:hypothetical protein
MIPKEGMIKFELFLCNTNAKTVFQQFSGLNFPRESIENSTPQREDQEEPTHRLQTKARFHFILGFLLHKKQRVQAEGSTQRERGGLPATFDDPHPFCIALW